MKTDANRIDNIVLFLRKESIEIIITRFNIAIVKSIYSILLLFKLLELFLDLLIELLILIIIQFIILKLGIHDLHKNQYL